MNFDFKMAQTFFICSSKSLHFSIRAAAAAVVVVVARAAAPVVLVAAKTPLCADWIEHIRTTYVYQ